MRYIIFFLLTLQVLCAHAQDMIHRTDGSIIEAKVLEVGQTVVKYKKAALPEGPTYTIYKTNIRKIVYENGVEEIYHVAEPKEPVESETTFYEENESKHFRSSIVMGQDLFQFYYRNISFFVESIKSPVYAIRYSFYINFKNDIERPHFPLQHGFSIFPHFFMYNNKYVHVFMGPHFHHGISRNPITVVVDEYYDGYEYIPIYGEETAVYWHNIFLAEPGISINPVENLDITIHGGVGFVSSFGDLKFVEGDGVSSSVKFAWKVGITLGGKW